MEISEKIKELRKAKGLSQAALGKLIGTSQSAINYFENKGNELTISQIERIAEALSISAKELLFGDSEVMIPNTKTDNMRKALITINNAKDREIEDLRNENFMNKKLLKDTINHTLDKIFEMVTMGMIMQNLNNDFATGILNKSISELKQLNFNDEEKMLIMYNTIKKDFSVGNIKSQYGALLIGFFSLFTGNDLDYFFEKKYIENKMYYKMYKYFQDVIMPQFE